MGCGEKCFVINPKTTKTNVVVDDKEKTVFKRIYIHSPNYDMTCLFIDDIGPSEGLFGGRGCVYSHKAIESGTYEANLCKDGEK